MDINKMEKELLEIKYKYIKLERKVNRISCELQLIKKDLRKKDD